jgi:hypothetical protein
MGSGKLISADKVTELVLELSAEALIQKRAAAKDSPAFQSMTGAISAYGRVLAELTILQESDELFALAGQSDDALEHVVMAEGVNYVA